MSTSYDTKRSPHIIIVGAGLAGISTAIQLKKQLNFENFTIYEKASAVGGTWRDNTYPGCGSDVPGHWYSLSTDLNPQWSSYFVGQPEIRAYWEGLYHKYDLVSHTKLGHTVVSAEWDSDSQCYSVVVRNIETGKQSHTEAEIMFYAIGGFMSPTYPKEIVGVEKFRGLSWHSARWRHDVQLNGKRVGVVGNGCSAAQFIPEISADPSVEVINFCRTPQWYVPRNNFYYPGWLKWVFTHVPLVMRWYRNFIMARSDIGFLIFRKENPRLLALARWLFSRYIKRTAPKKYVDKLIPTYPPGCKRIIVDPGYLETLHRPNVTLKWDAINAVVEDGVELKTGEVIPLDILIFGTGYSLEPEELKVKGRKETIHEYFASRGGPTAYLGSCIPGFPNCFIILGPNVAAGHASIIFSQETQIDFAIRLIKPILAGKAKSFEVTVETADRYNAWLQKRLSHSVWVDCNSYYQVGGQKGTKIIGTFPGPVILFWWLARWPRWGEFYGVGAEAWEKQRKQDGAKQRSFLEGVVILAAGMVFYWFRDPLLTLTRSILPTFI